MNWKKLLESIAASVNDALRLRNAYLATGNRILRQQINGRVLLTDSDRRVLAEMGAKLGKQTLAEIATVATPATILAWHRKCANQRIAPSAPCISVGRPRVDKEIAALVVCMARENRSWGSDRMQGALYHLGYTISDQTMGNILKRSGIPPAPERKKTVTWREFIRFHFDVLLATDFFSSDIWSGLGLLVSSFLCFIHCGRQHVHAVGMLMPPPMQAVPCPVLRAFNGRDRLQRWGWWLKTSARSWVIRCGAGLQCTTISAVTPDEERQPCTQDMGKVVCWSAAHSRQIRAGPMQHRQRFDLLCKDDLRRAA